jgi:ComF family protein
MHIILSFFFSAEPHEKQLLQQSTVNAIPRSSKNNHNWIFSIFSYQHPIIRSTIRTLKNKRNVDLARICAHHLYQYSKHKLQPSKDYLIIPIPLSKKRMRERGFNQTHLLAKCLVDQNKSHLKLFDNILIKTKDTQKQALIKNRAKRLTNVVGSFAIKNRETIKNKNIIIIDDVTTTGATLNEARKLLQEANPQSVIALTFAH